MLPATRSRTRALRTRAGRAMHRRLAGHRRTHRRSGIESRLRPVAGTGAGGQLRRACMLVPCFGIAMAFSRIDAGADCACLLNVIKSAKDHRRDHNLVVRAVVAEVDTAPAGAPAPEG